MQYFYSVFCTLITVSSTQLNLKSLVNLVCMSLDDEEEEETICFLSYTIHCITVPPSTSHPVFFYSTLLSPYVALMFLFLDHMSFSFLFYPTLPPSVLPLCGEMKWSVSWVYHPSSCCLPTATLFPSCVSAFLSPFPFASFCHSHRPSLFSIFHSIMSTPLSFSLTESIPSLLPLSLLFPPQTGLSGRFSHLSTCSLVLFYLHVHVSVFCTPWAHSSMWKTLLVSLRHKPGMSLGLSLSLALF